MATEVCFGFCLGMAVSSLFHKEWYAFAIQILTAFINLLLCFV